jgi:hypothetical protein
LLEVCDARLQVLKARAIRFAAGGLSEERQDIRSGERAADLPDPCGQSLRPVAHRSPAKPSGTVRALPTWSDGETVWNIQLLRSPARIGVRRFVAAAKDLHGRETPVDRP